MAEPLRLNHISMIVDGSNVIKNEDITAVDFSNLKEAPIVEKAFGGSFHTIPIEGAKNFSVTVKAQGDGQTILGELYNESLTDPHYHTFTVYDGGKTTMKFEKCLLEDCEPTYDLEASVKYRYTISALECRMEIV